jgi:hypothetical protein
MDMARCDPQQQARPLLKMIFVSAGLIGHCGPDSPPRLQRQLRCGLASALDLQPPVEGPWTADLAWAVAAETAVPALALLAISP